MVVSWPEETGGVAKVLHYESLTLDDGREITFLL
jgi:hypothetical protein